MLKDAKVATRPQPRPKSRAAFYSFGLEPAEQREGLRYVSAAGEFAISSQRECNPARTRK